MSKNLNISYLMDFYGQLLTEKQLEALELYYNADLSLAEIAAELDISRQGVRDFIKRGEKQLAAFEEKLGLAERFSDISLRLENILKSICAMRAEDASGRLARGFDSIEADIKTIQDEF